jgi:hypothetical protein
MRFVCGKERRREVVRRLGPKNGIDYLEISDADAPSEALRQRTLFVRLLRARPEPPAALAPENLRIDGGERIPVIGVEWVRFADDPSFPAGDPLLAGLDDPQTILVVRTTARGDYSRYTLRVVAGADDPAPHPDFDPLLAAVEFSFKVDCPTDFDCLEACHCEDEPRVSPAIDYLAKDYDGFRALMLDRLSLLSPGWTERNTADVGIALVELLAYLGDELSYRQDAVATEAYLATARRRTSLRRHARLVDHAVHEGANARAWVRVLVQSDTVIEARTRLLTRVEGLGERIVPDGPEERAALAAGAVTFEVAEDTALAKDLEVLDFWTWGDEDCCLPAGATAATLRGRHPQLAPGAVLVLAEVVSPTTGNEDDADPAKRAAVRLTSVSDAQDPAGGAFADPPVAGAVDVTEIAWGDEDALPFSLCVSDSGKAAGLAVSRVWGNIVLADHGRTIAAEPLPAVAAPVLDYALVPSCKPRHPDDGDPVPARYRPTLRYAPLTQASALPSAFAAAPSATATLATDPRRADPAIRLHSLRHGDAQTWSPQPDLLASEPSATEFVVEVEHDGLATLRFGDGVEHGQRPDEETTFTATYRVGNGVDGNVGAGALAHVATADGKIAGVDNPLAARGGVVPEDAEAIRRDAPEAFLVQQRAVTADDYARMTEHDRRVQRAAASFRWTGSWHTVFVTADRLGGGAVDRDFEDDVRRELEPVRMAGYDLEVDGPIFVALEVALHVCVLPDYFRGHVHAALLDVLSSGLRADGAPGLFHPDRFTFGVAVRLSPIVAAAQAVPGVMSVTATTFQRQRDATTSGLATGTLPMGRLEIAQLANDPSFPERGTLSLALGGGK